MSLCRSRASADGNPPTQEPQVCRHCKRELAAKWFAVQRLRPSGRRLQCRLGLHEICWPGTALLFASQHDDSDLSFSACSA